MLSYYLNAIIGKLNNHRVKNIKFNTVHINTLDIKYYSKLNTLKWSDVIHSGQSGFKKIYFAEQSVIQRMDYTRSKSMSIAIILRGTSSLYKG